MNKRFWNQVGYLWILGLVFFVLRLMHLRTGFEPDTGLAVPNAYATTLAWTAALYAAGEFVRCLTRPKGKWEHGDCFDRPERSMPLLVVASLLLAAGGVLLVVQALPEQGVAAIAAGVLAVGAGGGFLVLTRQVRAGEKPGVLPLLPAMFFSAFFLLAIYLPSAGDPVLSRFYIPVLAAAAAAGAFSALAAFLCGEGSLRVFTCLGGLAVVFSVTALADGGLARRFLFLGCAMLLSVFLYLCRAPGPEVKAETAEAESEAGSSHAP